MPISRSARADDGADPDRYAVAGGAGPPRRGGVLVPGRDVEHHAGHDLAVDARRRSRRRTAGGRRGSSRCRRSGRRSSAPRRCRARRRPPRRERVVGAGARAAAGGSAAPRPVGLGDDVDVAGLGAGDRRPRAARPDADQRPASRAVASGERRAARRRVGGGSRSVPAQRRARSPRGLGQQPTGQRSHSGADAPDGGPGDVLAALDRGPLEQQVADHRHEPRVDPGGRGPRGRAGRARSAVAIASVSRS